MQSANGIIFGIVVLLLVLGLLAFIGISDHRIARQRQLEDAQLKDEDKTE